MFEKSCLAGTLFSRDDLNILSLNKHWAPEIDSLMMKSDFREQN